MGPLGKQLYEYKLLAPLGSGGMADVYLAKDLNLQRAVAIKLVKEALRGDPRVERALLKEAEHAARVHHPHVAAVYRSGEWETQPFYVMELLHGGSVAECIERRMSFTLHQYLALFAQASAALHATVEAGVIHRDVKPGNLMLDTTGRLKLTDFGLARLRDAEGERTSWMMGTPLYIAPEIVQGEAGDVASDLYSLGASFFHLYVGQPPYVSDGRPFGVIEQHRHAPVPDLKKVSKRAPGALRELLGDLMAKNPQDRPDSFREVGERLRAMANVTRSSKLEGRLRWCTVDNVMTPSVGDRCGICKNRYSPSVTARKVFDVQIVGWHDPASPDRVAEYMAKAMGQESHTIRWQVTKLPFLVGSGVTTEFAGRMGPLLTELGADIEVVPAAGSRRDEPQGTRTLSYPAMWPPPLAGDLQVGRGGIFRRFG